MKSVLAVGLLTLAATVLCAQDKSASGGSSPSSSSANGGEKDILDVEQTYRDAILKQDMSVMEHLLRLDFMQVDTDGMVWTKRDLPPTPKMKAKPVLNAFKVKIYGDLAVVTGGETFPGPPATANRFIHIWVKSDGQWQLSINQLTRVKPPAKAPAKAHTPTAKT